LNKRNSLSESSSKCEIVELKDEPMVDNDNDNDVDDVEDGFNFDDFDKQFPPAQSPLDFELDGGDRGSRAMGSERRNDLDEHDFEMIR